MNKNAHPMKGYDQAIATARSGARWQGSVRGVSIIPGLYGMQNRYGWASWAPTEAERIANVNRLYGVNEPTS
jgi:hypothetical protein